MGNLRKSLSDGGGSSLVSGSPILRGKAQTHRHKPPKIFSFLNLHGTLVF